MNRVVPMDLVLTFCWREWRAQRSVLLAYTGTGLAALCLVFLLMPEHWWQEDGRRALSLSWFVVLGFVGVIAFATPALVRSEFGTKHDHFVRRLPGALLPSFGGKLLFLLLAAAAMPLVCLGCGQLFLLAIDKPWHDLFESTWGGDVTFRWPWPILATAPVWLLVPWVWAIGTWLPGGRMAIGGTAVFVLVLGLGLFAVLRQSPDIEKGIAWQSWLWTVPVVGLAVAALSWTKGRRGGGPLRSARFGLTAAAIGLAPPSVWLADRVWAYHHPDPQQLCRLWVYGGVPDTQCVLAFGAAHEHFSPVPFRIDLRDGTVRQLGGVDDYVRPLQNRPHTIWNDWGARYWQIEPRSARAGVDPIDVIDLVTGATTSFPSDGRFDPRDLPAAIVQTVAAEAREGMALRAPGGARAWFEDGAVCIEHAGGVVDRVQWNGKAPSAVRARGHGFVAHFPKEVTQSFDLTTRRQVVEKVAAHEIWFVQGTRIVTARNGKKLAAWHRQQADGEPTPIADLRGYEILGLFDDERLLCWTRGRGKQPARLFLWRASDGAVTDLQLPADIVSRGMWVDAHQPLGVTGSLLARDPAERLWLRAQDGVSDTFLFVDPTTLAITRMPDPPGAVRDGCRNRRVLAWPDADTAIVSEEPRILRIQVSTGERTVLFPRR